MDFTLGFNESNLDLREVQEKNFKSILPFCRSSPLYKEKLERFHITSIEELNKFPFTTKTDLLKFGPYGTLAIPLEKVVEIHSSSGSTGTPSFGFFSKNDLEITAKVLARTWRTHKISELDRIQFMAQYGLFSAGLLNYHALLEIGTFIIPAGVTATSQQQIKLIQSLKPNVLAGIVSYYFRLLEKIEEDQINPRELGIERIIAAGEPYSEETRKKIEKGFNAEVFDQYGLSEINTGLAGECYLHEGLHIQTDYAFPEIIDPVSGEILPDGKEGELVLTSLGREATPLLRFRTGDITSLIQKPCKCGLFQPRITRIKGRTDDIMFIKGIKLNPLHIEKIMLNLSDLVDGHIWKFVINGKYAKEKLTLFVKPKKNFHKDAINYIAEMFQTETGLRIEVIESEQLISDNVHKLKRIIDLRKNEM